MLYYFNIHTYIYVQGFNWLCQLHTCLVLYPDSLGEHLISRNNQSKQQLLCPNMNRYEDRDTTRPLHQISVLHIIVILGDSDVNSNLIEEGKRYDHLYIMHALPCHLASDSNHNSVFFLIHLIMYVTGYIIYFLKRSVYGNLWRQRRTKKITSIMKQ